MSPSLLQFVMDRQLEAGAIDCREAEETRDQLWLLEDEANKRKQDVHPDKEQKGVFTGGYEVKFKSAVRYSLLVDLRDFIETDQTGEEQS
ncbi:hypothetical protein [Parasutterella sp.]|uniref:hypothetical protein n=1 Tax=Parasutterella sp. TaxID=2049037 RepID=UPI003996BE1B